MVKKLLVFMVTLSFIGVSIAAIYKWVDEDGKVHYAERPPSGHEAQEIKPEAGPSAEEIKKARERREWLQEYQQQSEQRRKRTEDEKRLKEQEKEEEQRKKAEAMARCLQAQQNLHILRIQRPVYTINEKGERVFIDDEARAAAIAQSIEQVRRYCD